MERALFEDFEEKFLALYAVKSKFSRGREFVEKESVNRTCFQRDVDRIIHSKAFRRLKHKTQVFVAHEVEHDHYRSRLTHTIEVSHISRHLARLLFVNEDLVEAIALAHDLGHTPFGHAGEQELNFLMVNFGGFEHNLQSKRIVEKLEQRYPDFYGLNLSFETRAGLSKHEHLVKDTKTQLKEKFVSLEAELVNKADEITYNNHDLDDGLQANIIDLADLERKVTLWRIAIERVKNEYQNLTQEQLIHLTISYLISHQIMDLVKETNNNIKLNNIISIDDLQKNNLKIVEYNKENYFYNEELKKFLYNNFYLYPTILDKMKKGREIVRFLFQYFQKHPEKIPELYDNSIYENEPIERRIADYIAGMTDQFAETKFFELSKCSYS